MTRALLALALLLAGCGGEADRTPLRDRLPRPAEPGCHSFDRELAAEAAEAAGTTCDPTSTDLEPFVCRGAADPGFECARLLSDCTTPDCSAPSDLVWRCCNVTRPLGP